eukprot:m51a1_g4588 hypothetical protein (159) ;mRNA; f:185204-185791
MLRITLLLAVQMRVPRRLRPNLVALLAVLSTLGQLLAFVSVRPPCNWSLRDLAEPFAVAALELGYGGRGLGPSCAEGAPKGSSNVPVDIVYAWVDGSDPQWRAQFTQWSVGEKYRPGTIGECRFRSSSEICYALSKECQVADWPRHRTVCRINKYTVA